MSESGEGKVRFYISFGENEDVVGDKRDCCYE